MGLEISWGLFQPQCFDDLCPDYFVESKFIFLLLQSVLIQNYSTLYLYLDSGYLNMWITFWTLFSTEVTPKWNISESVSLCLILLTKASSKLTFLLLTYAYKKYRKGLWLLNVQKILQLRIVQGSFTLEKDLFEGKST